MAFKFVAFAALFALANVGAHPTSHVSYTTPSVQHVMHQYQQAHTEASVAEHEMKNYDHEYNAHPKYSFSYDVHDSHTGDIKAQQETRDGDVVKGSYSFIEADGTRRIVQYTVDSHSGFNAIVHKQPATNVEYKNVAPVNNKAYNAPVEYKAYSKPTEYKSYSKPAEYKAYSAPIEHKAYSAPVEYKAYSAPVEYKAYSAPVEYKAYSKPAEYKAYIAPVEYKAYSAPVEYKAYSAPVEYKAYNTPAAYPAYSYHH
ncbi:hypothetical protein PV328_010849 [Microctonus aethiopoides]|uniref:Cuticle protein n=1 Tax=Microctonus aethiopoides TaxID=144406 RepID=A0AA39FIV9_9HYME|nr:hypothetical protein PV328_010849 [Microctonus aethiopoides]